MKRSDLLKSTTAAGPGSVTRIHKSAARGHADPIPAGKLWRIVRTGLAALTVSFLVSVGQAAAAPGEGPRIQLRDKHPQVGHPVRLRALNLPAEHKHVLWSLEAQPPGSKAKLHNQTSSEPSFVPDVLGLFRVRLTDGSDWTRTATLDVPVTLTETAPTYPPLVPVNTIAFNAQGQPGMQVGGQFNLDPGNGTGLDVLVLDRNSLGVIYQYSEQLTASDIAGMQGNFQGMVNGNANNLVLVSLPASAGPVPSDLVAPLSEALNLIGGSLPGRFLFEPLGSPCWTSNVIACPNDYWYGPGYGNLGSFSVIGVPGMAAGSAWYDDAAQRGTTNGPLVGYLAQGSGVNIANPNAYLFVFSPDQYVLVDSCASGGPNNCVIQVGSQTFTPPQGANGVHVVVLDRVTLQVLADQIVTTSTQALFSALANHEPVAPEGQLVTVQYDPGSSSNVEGNFSDRELFVIQSVGTGALTYDAASGLLQIIDQMGGTPETFGKAIAPTGGASTQPYTLIGVMNNLPWHGRGIESSPVMVLGPTQTSNKTATPFPGHARGALARDRLGRYTPAADDPSGNAVLDMLPIIYQNLTPWPYAGSCSVEYIAVQLNLATVNSEGVVTAGNPDIRSRYYADPNNSWNDQDPPSVKYPAPTNPVPSQQVFPSYCPQSSFLSPQDYASLQQQLSNEFTWVDQVYDLFQSSTGLPAPFIETDGSGNSIAASTAAAVIKSISTPPTSNAILGWTDVFNLAAAVTAAIAPEASAALWVVSASGQMTSDLMTSSSAGNPATKVVAEAEQLASQLDDQNLAHLSGLDLLFGILVQDAGKLQAAGSNILLDSAGWNWPDTAAGDTVTSLNATSTQTAYSALLPPTWFGYNLKPDLVHQFYSSDVSKFGCGFHDQSGGENISGVTLTFYNKGSGGIPDPANEFQAQIQLVPGLETENTEVWTFGIVNGNFNTTGQYAKYPTTNPPLTDPLFSIPPNSTSPTVGTVSGAAYPPAWWRSTYSPPSYVVCDNTYGSTDSYQGHPSAVIPPPAAAYGQQ